MSALKGQVECLLACHEEAVKIGDGHSKIMASQQLRELGDLLTKKLVCSCDSLDELLMKWIDHGYRPTLRDPECLVLADIYDFRARELGINITAYRG